MLVAVDLGERVLFHSLFKLGICDVCVNLRCIEVFVPENLFKHSYVHAVLIHERSRSMAQFMGRKPDIIQPAGFQTFGNYLLDTSVCYPCPTLAEKQRVALEIPHRLRISQPCPSSAS